MARPTAGEQIHGKVFTYMRSHLVGRDDMQNATAKTINEIAREAAGMAKRHLENADS